MDYEEYTLSQEIKSETKVGLGLYAFDFFFILIYGVVTFVAGNAVHEELRVAFYIFSLLMAIFLTMPSMFNKKRRNYESIIIYLRKNTEVFRPVKNISKQRKRKEEK